MSIQISQTLSISQLAPEKIDLLKRTVCKGATNEELELFIHACNRTGLDPFMRQIYFVKMGGQMTIQTGIDGYRLIAERSKKYMPGKETTFVYAKDGKLFSATSYVKKLGPDNTWHEVAATAIFSEYVGKGPLWGSKPHIMIAKCSEALALRKAFPADLSGVYTPEEMSQSEQDAPPQTEEIKDPPLELIGPQGAEELEAMIDPENEGEPRTRVLKFFYEVEKIPFENCFDEIPKRRWNAIVKTLKKLQDEKQKSSSDEIPF